MNKNIYKILYILSIILVICFIIYLIIDYFNYDSIITSAPFYVNIIIRLLEFILPSIILFIIGFILKNKK